MDSWALGDPPSYQMIIDHPEENVLDDLLPEDPPINDGPDDDPSWYLIQRITQSKQIIQCSDEQTSQWIRRHNSKTVMGRQFRYKKSQVMKFMRRKMKTNDLRHMTVSMQNHFEEIILYHRIHISRIDQIHHRMVGHCQTIMKQIYEFEQVKLESMFQCDIIACDIHIQFMVAMFQEWVDNAVKMDTEAKKTKEFIKRCVQMFNTSAP